MVDSEVPVACFKYHPKKPNSNTDIQFDGSCASDDRTPDSQLGFEWDFESDGIVDATGIEPRHRYGAAGTFRVTLRVTDADGLRSTTEKQITVRPNE